MCLGIKNICHEFIFSLKEKYETLIWSGFWLNYVDNLYSIFIYVYLNMNLFINKYFYSKIYYQLYRNP